MRRLLLLVLLVAMLVGVRSDRAAACTCFPFDGAQALTESEGAFIGRLLVRQEATGDAGEDAPDLIRHNSFVYRFRVDETVKGTFPSEVDIRSGEGGGDCGLETAIGEPVGLFVGRWQGQLTSDLCSQVPPQRLRQAVSPVPKPNGQPPPRLLVGTSYGGGRLLSLDNRGRVVAFGGGQGQTTLIAVCPGAVRLAEVFVPPESSPMQVPAVVVRTVDGLAVEREVPLPGFGPSDGVYREVEAVTCSDAAARNLVLFVREDSPNYHSRVVRLRGTDMTTRWEGTATHGAYDANGRLAYLTGGRRGTDLLAVDLAANPVTARRVATIPEDPGSPAVNKQGTVAVLTGGPMSLAPASAPLTLVTVDPTTGRVRRVAVPGESPSGTVVWAPEQRLVFVPDSPFDPVRLYDEELTEMAVWQGWESSRAVVEAGRLVGLDQGIVRSAPIGGGPVLTLAELGDGLPGALVVVPAADDTRLETGDVPATAPTGTPKTGHDQGSGDTIVALAAVFLAGTVLAVRFSSRRNVESKHA